MAKPKQVVIKSYDDVDVLLREIIKQYEDFKNTNIIIGEDLDGIKIHLKGDIFDSTITTGIMRGILKMQKSLYDGYSLMKYGTINKLSSEEKKMLELQVRVDEGSSVIEILITSVAKGLEERMKTLPTKDIKHIVGLIVLGCGVFATSAKIIDAKKEIAMLETQGKIVSEVQKNTILAIEKMQEGAKGLNRALADQEFDSLEINGQTVTSQELKEWTKTERKKKPLDTKVYKGRFIITDIHFENDTIYLDVINVSDNTKINYINLVEELVSEDDYQWFKDSTNRQAIDMTIVGTLKDDKIIAAFLQDFKK